MNVVIIEDEKNAAENLETMLHQIDRNIHVQRNIDSIEESVNWLSNNNTDLIFLDIHLEIKVSLLGIHNFNTILVFTMLVQSLPGIREVSAGTTICLVNLLGDHVECCISFANLGVNGIQQ